MIYLIGIISGALLVLLTIGIWRPFLPEEIWQEVSYYFRLGMFKLGLITIECDYEIIVVNGYMGSTHTTRYFPFLGKYSWTKRAFAHCSCSLYLPETHPKSLRFKKGSA